MNANLSDGQFGSVNSGADMTGLNGPLGSYGGASVTGAGMGGFGPGSLLGGF